MVDRDSPDNLDCQQRYQGLHGRDTYTIRRAIKTIASTANVTNVPNLVRFPQFWKSRRYLPCHLAVFPSPRKRSCDSRPEAKSDSSSSGTAAILCLQREGLADMGFSHQRMCACRQNSSATRKDMLPILRPSC